MPDRKSSIWQKISKIGIMLIFAAAFVLFFLYGKIIPENLVVTLLIIKKRPKALALRRV